MPIGSRSRQTLSLPKFTSPNRGGPLPSPGLMNTPDPGEVATFGISLFCNAPRCSRGVRKTRGVWGAERCSGSPKGSCPPKDARVVVRTSLGCLGGGSPCTAAASLRPPDPPCHFGHCAQQILSCACRTFHQPRLSPGDESYCRNSVSKSFTALDRYSLKYVFYGEVD